MGAINKAGLGVSPIKLAPPVLKKDLPKSSGSSNVSHTPPAGQIEGGGADEGSSSSSTISSEFSSDAGDEETDPRERLLNKLTRKNVCLS